MTASPSQELSNLGRREVVSTLLSNREEMLVVTGLGSATYDVHAAGDRDDNYYLWGAMGGAALVGLGLAQAQPKKRVLVITGDGEQLMAFGSLATISVARPRNLVIAVIDNHHYGETGMQLSHTGHGIDFTKIAKACGFADCATLTRIARRSRARRRTEALRHQGRGRKPASLTAAARCRLRQDPFPQPSRIRPKLRSAP
jgi:thiamine pyrophosphate-dependent acetolactate synthase large subunit-like protein